MILNNNAANIVNVFYKKKFSTLNFSRNSGKKCAIDHVIC